MGYPALNSGMAISPRGMGAVISLIIVGRLVSLVDMRLLIVVGFSLLAYACWLFGGINLDIATMDVIWPNVISGLGMAAIFVPLTTASMGSLPNEEMGNAAGIFNLARNIGGGIGISLTTTLVARGTQAHQALLAGRLSPLRPAFLHQLQQRPERWLPSSARRTVKAYGLLYGKLLQQVEPLGLRRHLPAPGRALPAVRSRGVAVQEGQAREGAGGNALRLTDCR